MSGVLEKESGMAVMPNYRTVDFIGDCCDHCGGQIKRRIVIVNRAIAGIKFHNPPTMIHGTVRRPISAIQIAVSEEEVIPQGKPPVREYEETPGIEKQPEQELEIGGGCMEVAETEKGE